MLQKIEAVTSLLFTLGLLLGFLANVLPNGKLKTFASYAGTRIVKGVTEARAVLPKDPKP